MYSIRVALCGLNPVVGIEYMSLSPGDACAEREITGHQYCHWPGHGPGPANLRASYCSLYLVTFIFTAQEKSQCDPFSSSRTLILEVETRKASIIHHAGDIQYVQPVRLAAGPRNVLATLSFSTIFYAQCGPTDTDSSHYQAGLQDDTPTLEKRCPSAFRRELDQRSAHQG